MASPATVLFLSDGLLEHWRETTRVPCRHTPTKLEQYYASNDVQSLREKKDAVVVASVEKLKGFATSRWR